jgi:biotin carboxyl carrier protein
MEHRFLLAEEEVNLGVSAEPGGWRVRLPDGTERRIEARRVGETEVEIAVAANGESRAFRVVAARTERGIEVAWNGDVYLFAPVDRGRSAASRQAGGTLAAPMPGIVVDVLVEAGQTVEAFQPLAVVEAMKVMATVEAPFAGTVAAVHARKGARVRQGEALVEITPPTEEPETAGRNEPPPRGTMARPPGRKEKNRP